MQKVKILGIIPARYASTRFPGKILADINGKSMIQRVFEQVSQAKSLKKIIVATDHPKVFDHVQRFGGNVMMTSNTHQSGTDRCAEVLAKTDEKYGYVINIQGDEPFILPTQIDQLASLLNNNTQIATLIKKIDNYDTLFDKNEVKVVFDNNNKALYFSREAIPHCRSIDKENWIKKHSYYKHLGLYGYKTDILLEITQLSVSALEIAESLEQLRWLENGYQIKVGETLHESICIETPEDLEKLKKTKV